MNKTGILIIEDDKAIRNLIATTLELHNYHYVCSDKGEQGVLTAASQRPDIILLDLGLPDMDGVDVIKKIRSWSKTPIIVISARSEDRDKIGALDAGADDYLTKPFSVEELLARIRSTQRRLSYMQTQAEAGSSVFTNGGLTIDYAAGFALMEGKELHLTPYEYKLLCLLARNAGRALTHSFIIREIWGTAWDGEVASLRVFMASLRKKIEKNSSHPQYIQTHVGVGYRMLRREESQVTE